MPDSSPPARPADAPALFAPLQVRELRLRNRIVVSPMCQYSADDGLANDWHLVHAGKFAQGGAAAVILEATAVEANGRITHGDLGLWSDEHVDGLGRLVRFVQGQGAAAGVQLGHAGRKSSMARPWEGNGPLTPALLADGRVPWSSVGPSPLPIGPEWPTPQALSALDIDRIVDAFVAATRRADAAGFDLVEIHGAHGYLIHSFLSPLSNQRRDRWGGSLENRMRLALDVTTAVRAAWPAAKPLFFRTSAVDNDPAGWSLDDSVALARALRDRGVDVLDCSSGGIAGPATASNVAPRRLGFQVPLADRLRRDAGLATMAVGLILDPAQADEVVRTGAADLVAIGREALYNPNWPVHAARSLGADPAFALWPEQYGWWLSRRDSVLRGLGHSPR